MSTPARITGFFQFYKDTRGEFRWTKYADSSGSVLLARSSEGYHNKSDCENNARRFGYEGHWYYVAEDDWTKYQDNSNQWRWQRKATNSLIVGASHMGWTNESDMLHNARINGFPH